MQIIHVREVFKISTRILMNYSNLHALTAVPYFCQQFTHRTLPFPFQVLACRLIDLIQQLFDLFEQLVLAHPKFMYDVYILTHTCFGASLIPNPVIWSPSI